MMFTRCPDCGTAFRVVPAQLKARQGWVRCGQCMASFDALASLAEDAGEMPPPMEAGTIAADIAAPSPEVVPPSSDAADEQPPDDRLEPTMAPAAELAAAPEPSAELAPPTPTAPAALPEPRLHEISSGQRSGPWLVGGALALAALSMQAAVHFRATLAARLPEARPLLAALCEPIGCALEPPRQIDLIEIESSDLTPDPQTPGHLQLVATLRNKASFAQAWPHLELTLTDVSDRALLRRALAPAEYLPATAPAKDGFVAGGDRVVHLDLHAADTPAVGYRLYLFYP
ncbi:MAG: zinc-ribbon domain-containing protein [Rhodocyclaceae bacterium]|nr:zinc-ribbon domain-containing protein [Rhodocyclaceae bacterium]